MVYGTTGQRFESSWAYQPTESEALPFGVGSGEFDRMTVTESRLHEAMEEALQLAEHAWKEGDVPVGAVILDDTGTVIGRGWNTREAKNDPLGHAELMAIQEASKKLGSWRLQDTTLVVTLEPCVMCAGGLVAARIKTLVFGAFDRKAGAACSLYAVPQDPRLNHRIHVVGGVMEDRAKELLERFFSGLRKTELK